MEGRYVRETLAAFVRAEPAAIAAIVGAVAVLAATFGFELDREQALVVALGVQGLVGLAIRAAVSSPATVETVRDQAFEAGVEVGYQSARTDGRLNREAP
jgi:glucose-6-phosphate-specific signal transduction histidine kinase